MSILSTIPTWLLTVLLEITKRSSQVRPADNKPGGKRRQGGREYCKLHPEKQSKNPQTETWKKFLFKKQISAGSSHTVRAAQSRAGQGLCRNQGSGGRRGPGAQDEGGCATRRSPPRSGTHGPQGAQPRHSARPRDPAASAAGGPAGSLLPDFVASGSGPAARERWSRENGTQPRVGRPSNTAARTAPDALQEYPWTPPPTPGGSSARTRRADKTQLCADSIAPKDSERVGS